MPIKDQTRSWSLFIINIRQLSVQLCCFHQNGKVKCTARIRVAVQNALIIKNVGLRVSKENKKNKTKPIFKINWELPEATNPKNWKVVPESVIPHTCNPVHRYFAVRDTFRSMNAKDSIEKNRNLSEINLESLTYLQKINWKNLHLKTFYWTIYGH